MRAVVETGTPVVLVLVGGRPMGSEWIHEHVSAVVMAWLPGAEGAEAIADVLVGAYNPGGKLPISSPLGGQIDTTPTRCRAAGPTGRATTSIRRRPALPVRPRPQYTEFRIEGATVEPNTVEMDGSVTVGPHATSATATAKRSCRCTSATSRRASPARSRS